MSKGRKRPEAGQVEKDQHPDRSRNAPRSSNNRNTDIGDKVFPKSDTEDKETVEMYLNMVEEMLEQQENKIEQLERELEEVRKKAENNQLYIQNGWTQ